MLFLEFVKAYDCFGQWHGAEAILGNVLIFISILSYHVRHWITYWRDLETSRKMRDT